MAGSVHRSQIRRHWHLSWEFVMMLVLAQVAVEQRQTGLRRQIQHQQKKLVVLSLVQVAVSLCWEVRPQERRHLVHQDHT